VPDPNATLTVRTRGKRIARAAQTATTDQAHRVFSPAALLATTPVAALAMMEGLNSNRALHGSSIAHARKELL
jgi:hypothetical protein